jgi:hypothetical protein
VFYATPDDPEESHSVYVQPFTPVDELIGTRMGSLAFARKPPLLGATGEELAQAYGVAFKRVMDELGEIELGATEWDRSFVIEVYFKRDRVASYALWFHERDNLNARKAGDRILTTVFGHVPTVEPGRVLMLPRALLSRSGSSWHLTLDR